MNDLSGTARVARDRTQHHRWRGPLSDSRGLPWACPRGLGGGKSGLRALTPTYHSDGATASRRFPVT